MLRLVEFLYERRVLLVFLLLEIFSIVLLRNNSPYYSASYFSSSNRIAGFVYNSRTTIVNYFDLLNINNDLLKENALLKSRSYNKFSSYKYLKKSFKNNFEALESMVINNTVNQNNNFITLDIGKNEGVDVGMGVVGEKGVLGRVYAVNDNYSTVTSILHSEVFTSVKVGKKGVLASMNWGGKDARYMKINFLPRHVEVSEGDSVYTSGYNSIYPEGIFLGVIDKLLTEGDKSFHEIEMKLAIEMNKLKYAYLVINKRNAEIKEVQKMIKNE